MIEASRLTELWHRQWPDCPPQADRLKHAYPARWVRFHSLPGSQRYAGDEHEYAILLDRYNTVIHELAGETDLLLITCQWGESEQPEPREEELVALDPAGAFWWGLPPDDYSECWTHLYASEVAWARGRLDLVLQAVADYVLAGVMIVPPDLTWIYHPYDGGADVLFPTRSQRDQLRERHRDWLSVHSAGL